MDEMNLEILEDGSLKIETSKISAANHGNATILVQQIMKNSGGKSKVERRSSHSHHHHKHGEEHHHH